MAIREYFDTYGNRCGRVVVPAGRVVFRNDAIVTDCGLPDLQIWNAPQVNVQDLPQEALLFLLASRYCEVDSELKDIAWTLFGERLPVGRAVQAICDFAHQHIRFDYSQARANRTALGIYRERVGVCRDYMHLAITFCRCLNIPARYCTGYLGDIGVPICALSDGFQRWFEAYLGGQWYSFDARNKVPRIRPRVDGPRPRRGGRGNDDDVRRQSTSIVPRVDRRSPSGFSETANAVGCRSIATMTYCLGMMMRGKENSLPSLQTF